MKSESSDFGGGQGDTEVRGSPSRLVCSRCTEPGDFLVWQEGEQISTPAHQTQEFMQRPSPGLGFLGGISGIRTQTGTL